jgi:hypothetical protein
MISAVFSRFSGGFRGYNAVSQDDIPSGMDTYWFGKKKVVVFRLYPQIFEDGIRPESLHVVPILHLPMSDRVVYPVSWPSSCCKCFISNEEVEVLSASLA